MEAVQEIHTQVTLRCQNEHIQQNVEKAFLEKNYVLLFCSGGEDFLHLFIKQNEKKICVFCDHLMSFAPPPSDKNIIGVLMQMRFSGRNYKLIWPEDVPS